MNFGGKLEKAVIDKVVTKEFFNTLSCTKIMWALQKYYNRSRAPNSDACEAIILRDDLLKAKVVVH